MNEHLISKEDEKVITRKLKARLSKRHLAKLLKEVQEQDYDGKPRYIPRSYFNEERCLKSFWLVSIHREGQYLIYKINRRWDSIDLPIEIKFNQSLLHAHNEHLFFRASGYSGCICFDEIGKYVDIVLKQWCIACDFWFKDSTAIPVYL